MLPELIKSCLFVFEVELPAQYPCGFKIKMKNKQAANLDF